MDQVHRLKLPWIRTCPSSSDIQDVLVSPHTSPGILSEKIKRDFGILSSDEFRGMKGDIMREYGEIAERIWNEIEKGSIIYVNNICAPGGREKRATMTGKREDSMLKSRVVFVDDFASVLINAV